VVVKKGKGQFLQMFKEIPPHVRLNKGPHGMSPIGYKIGKTHPQKVEKEHKGCHDKEKPVLQGGQQFFYRIFGHHGEKQIRKSYEGCEKHIRPKEFPVGPVIGCEDLQYRFVKGLFAVHIAL
jgi:hypothetical protein